VQPRHLCRRQAELASTQIVVELCLIAHSDDHSRGGWAIEYRVERHLGDAVAALAGDRLQLVDDRVEFVFEAGP
jgi:hypothetical protein